MASSGALLRVVRRHAREALVVMAALIASAGAAFVLPQTGKPGLAVRYGAADASGAPITDTTGVLPTTRELRHIAHALGPHALWAEWRGFLHVETAGDFAFLIRATGDTRLFLDERPVDTASPETPAVVTLAPGPHFLRLRYDRSDAPHELAVLWGPAGTRLGALTFEQTSAQAGQRPRHVAAWRRAAVAVPVVWAVLLLYVPVRVLGSAMWRAVRRAEPDPAARRLLVAVLVLAAGLAVWGIDWGIGFDDWAPDEMRPNHVRDALAARFANGWYDKYPALHYMVLGLPLLGFELAERLPRLTADGLWSFTAQYVIIRLVSTLAGLGALLAAFVCGTELFGRRRAVFAPLVLALTPLFTFYAKLSNLDMPQLCWTGWALLGFIRIAKGGGAGAFVLLGVGAAAAVATKDLAYASLALLAPAVAAIVYRQAGGTVGARLRATVTDRRIWLGLLATAAATVVFQNIVLNPTGFRSHLHELLGYTDIGSEPRTVAGAWALTWRTADLLRMSLGWPTFLCALAGLAAAWRRPDRRWWCWLLLVLPSFHLTFTWVTFYVCDRYLFTGVYVLALFAGSAIGDAFDSGGWRRAAAALALLVSVPYAASINTMMDLDARHVARDFVVRHTLADETVALVGRYVPYIAPPLRTAVIMSDDELNASAPAFVLVNARFASRFETARRPNGRGLMRGLRNGTLGYDLALAYRARPPAWAWLQYEPTFRRRGEAWWTNLDKVNPEVEVYRRRRNEP